MHRSPLNARQGLLGLTALALLSIFATSQPTPPAPQQEELLVRRVAPIEGDDAFLLRIAREASRALRRSVPEREPLAVVQDALLDQGRLLRAESPPTQYLVVIDPVTGEEYIICMMGERLYVADPDGGPDLELLMTTSSPR